MVPAFKENYERKMGRMKFSKDTNAKDANTKSVLLFRGFLGMGRFAAGRRNFAVWPTSSSVKYCAFRIGGCVCVCMRCFCLSSERSLGKVVGFTGLASRKHA